MGFSIGGLLGKVLGPVLGTVIGGPIGTAISTAGTALGTIFNGSNGAGSQVGPTVAALVPGVQQAGIGTAITRAVVGVLSVIELLQLSRSTTGRPASVKKVVEAVRVCGISEAANLFGLSETQICQIVVSRRRRRARGISAVDLRRTRSTIRKVHNITHDLKRLSPSVRRHHR